MKFRFVGQTGLAAVMLAALGACASTGASGGGPVASAPPPPPPPPAPSAPEPELGDVRSLPDFDDLEPPAAGGPAPRPRRALSSAGGSSGAEAPRPGKDYLPYIDVAINRAMMEDEYGETLQDRYTRLRIVTIKPDAYDMESVSKGTKRNKVDTRNYDDESRGWLSRMMSSRNVTRTLIAEFDISKPDITATKALFSATFSSDSKKGEVWSTNESIAVYPTPYFKIGPSTTIEARVRMQLADERQSSAGANVVGALTQAANLIAPASTLVTYFNAPLMVEASNFLNNSASTLLGQSITEQSTSAFSLKTWTPDEPILVLSAEMPDANQIKNTDQKGSVGQWEVYLDKPIPSIFVNDLRGSGEPDFSRITAGDILSFEVGEDLTIHDYLFSRLDLADDIATLNRTSDANTARLICARMTRGMSEIGFTSYDSAAGMWAATNSDQFNINARNVLQQQGICDGMNLWLELSK